MSKRKIALAFTRSWVECGGALLAALAWTAASAANLKVAVTDLHGRPLAEAVVYAMPVAGSAPAPDGVPRAVIDQVNKTFVPLVSVIRTGTEVRFPNSDNIRHSLYSFSPAKVFTAKLYSGKEAAPVIFDKPGLVVLGCNIHDQMVAWIVVVDAPYFGKTGADGVADAQGAGAGRLSASHMVPGTDLRAPRRCASCGGSGGGDQGLHGHCRIAFADVEGSRQGVALMRIKRLRTRIILFFVALLALVQIAALALVNLANLRNAHVKATDDLAVGERVFERLIEQRARRARPSRASTGFGFRVSRGRSNRRCSHHQFGSREPRQPHRRRGHAVVGSDGQVVGDTLTRSSVPRRFEYLALLEPQATRGSTIELLGGRALQLVVAPVLSPLPIGWIVVGVPVDDGFARDLRQLTSLEVSFLLEDEAEHWRPLASTLPAAEQQSLLVHMAKWPRSAETEIVRAGGDDFQARLITLEQTGRGRVVAILDRSLTSALASFEKLRATLVALAVASSWCQSSAASPSRPTSPGP